MLKFIKLSTLLNRMDRNTTVSNVEEQYKVRDLDESIRALRRKMPFPWNLKKASIKVFDGVFIYAPEADHDGLAFYDDTNKTYSEKPDFQFTSIEQFMEDPTQENVLADIYESGAQLLGIRLKDIELGSSILNNAETLADWTVSGDASNASLDSVNFKEGNACIEFDVTLNTGLSTIVNTTDLASDSEYKRKHVFKWIEMPGIPTGIEYRVETDASNYISKDVTEQFSGQAFKANEYNLLSFDMSDADETGTFDPANITQERLVLTNAPTGTYRVDSSYFRAWKKLDHWYFSKNSVAQLTDDAATQQYFYDDNETYELDSSIVADENWIDVIMFDAMLTSLGDEENEKAYAVVSGKRGAAWSDFLASFPSMEKVITTDYYLFENDYRRPYAN